MMSSLFSGLEAFGLGKLSDMNVYENGDDSNKKTPMRDTREVKIIQESEIIFDKTFTCPVCDNDFKAKTVKTGKVKLISADTDLRPKYQYVDSLKYDAIVCPHCGYSALKRFFNYMTVKQAKLIMENISSHFRGLNQEGETLSYDEAIARHKLALVSSIVKQAKASEKAYTCLKTAWVIRGEAEALATEQPKNESDIQALVKEEKEFLSKAYEGFTEAFIKENFPMCGMDEITITYLLADLARRTDKYDEASRWISKVLISRDANDRIKEKARELKEIMRQH